MGHWPRTLSACNWPIVLFTYFDIIRDMKKIRKSKHQVETDYGTFTVALEREPDMGGYMVTVPKMKDVATWGKTQKNACAMAKEAIECSVEGEVLIAAQEEGLVTIRRKAPVFV